MEITGSTVKKYIRGLTLAGCVTGSTKSYYQYDAHGNVVQLTNASGVVTQSYDYDAFGNQFSPSLTDSNLFRYSGEYFDEETDFYYLRARQYSPAIGRFTQEDTYRGEYASPLSLNLYIYCYNDPVQYVDSSGHSADTVFDAISFADSLAALITNPNLLTLTMAAIDAVALAAPFIPSPGTIARALETIVDVAKGNKPAEVLDELIDGMKKVSDEAVDGAKAAKKKKGVARELPNSKRLRENMIEAGRKPPAYPNDAHHIIAGKHAKAENCRKILDKYGIGINSHVNGVYLPNQRGTSTAAYHPSLSNSTAYYSKVESMLMAVDNEEATAADIIQVLDDIANQLLQGTFLP